MSERKSRQIAVRLPGAVDAALEAYMQAHGLSLSQAVVSLLSEALGVEGASVVQPHGNALHDIVMRLEALEAAMAALKLGFIEEAPEAVGNCPDSGSELPSLDAAREYLGRLCSRGHDWQSTGKSRRSIRNNGCFECEAEDARKRRANRRSFG